MNKKTQKIICTTFSNGKKHDFKLLKESKVRAHPKIKLKTDSGYQGLQKIHPNTDLPKKKKKKTPLTEEEKRHNKKLASERALNEHAIPNADYKNANAKTIHQTTQKNGRLGS